MMQHRLDVCPGSSFKVYYWLGVTMVKGEKMSDEQRLKRSATMIGRRQPMCFNHNGMKLDHTSSMFIALCVSVVSTSSNMTPGT